MLNEHMLYNLKGDSMMKRFWVCLLTVILLLSTAVVGTSAISVNVEDHSWVEAELKPLVIQSDSNIYSEHAEDYYEFWWEDEVPESDGNWLQASTINMRGFGMSADGRYMYMGTLNGGTGVRGVVVYDTQKCVVTDLYYHYDGESGLDGSPYSYAKGISADDRGYVYVGFAFSKNYNVVNLGIAQQKDDGTLEEVAFEAAYEFGNPGDSSGIHVGVNGVDVVKIGEKYYCYVMTNYDYDALYCFDVTDPTNPTLNKEFGINGMIEFSAASNTVAGAGFTLKEGQYMDVDEDGAVWLVVNANEGKDGIMKIAADGSACVDVVEMAGIYSVEHEGAYLLCGMKDGSAVVVLDDTTYETIATIEVPADYGDRVTRMLVINDVLFVCDAGSDTNPTNTVHAAALSAEGQSFLEQLIANQVNYGKEEGTEASTDDQAPADTDPADTKAPADTEASADTQAPADTKAPAGDGTKAPEATTPVAESGCASTVGFAAVAVLMAAAAFVARKKD